MELILYVADEDGLINLGGIVPPGTHYTAARNENTGVVRLTPVKVATTAPKSAEPTGTISDGAALPDANGEAPWE